MNDIVGPLLLAVCIALAVSTVPVSASTSPFASLEDAAPLCTTTSPTCDEFDQCNPFKSTDGRGTAGVCVSVANNCNPKVDKNCTTGPFSCSCNVGYHKNASHCNCSLYDKSDPSQGTGMSVGKLALIMILIMLSLVCLERFFASCKKVYIRKTRGEGFQELPYVTGQFDDLSDEEFRLSDDDDYPTAPRGRDIEMTVGPYSSRSPPQRSSSGRQDTSFEQL